MPGGDRPAKTLLAVTDDDLANVSIALDAQRLNPRIVVTVRIFDQRLAAHLETRMQISRALSTSALAAPAFVAAALGGAVHGAFEADGTRWTVESENVPAGSPWIDATVAQAAFGARTLLAIERGPEVLMRPAADVKLAVGDRLTFLAPPKAARAVYHPRGTRALAGPASGEWWPAYASGGRKRRWPSVSRSWRWWRWSS